MFSIKLSSIFAQIISDEEKKDKIGYDLDKDY